MPADMARFGRDAGPIDMRQISAEYGRVELTTDVAPRRAMAGSTIDRTPSLWRPVMPLVENALGPRVLVGHH
jgi:hypothetical protein